MKLLDKTIFRGKVLEIESLQKRLEGKQKELEKIVIESNNKNLVINNLKAQLDETNKISSETLSKALTDNTKLKDRISQLEKDKRELAGAIGGLTKHNNKLIAENTELAYKITEISTEFEEFKKGKYVVVELEPQKVPKSTQTMGMRSGTKTSKIISKVKPNEKEEVEV